MTYIMAKPLKPKVALTVANLQQFTISSNFQLIYSYLKVHPLNTDFMTVASKIALIDSTNSTHLALYQNVFSISDIADIIVDLAINYNLDTLIQNGETQAIEKIAQACKLKGINLFSFATKYCCYHNICVYGKDDYSIYDSVFATYLPYYASVSTYKIETCRANMDYKSYNKLIENILNTHKINIPDRRRLFDNFIWKTYK